MPTTTAALSSTEASHGVMKKKKKKKQTHRPNALCCSMFSWIGFNIRCFTKSHVANRTARPSHQWRLLDKGRV
jgi:hypothetical protein